MLRLTVNQKVCCNTWLNQEVEQTGTIITSNDEIPGRQALSQKKVVGHQALQG